MAIQIGAGEEIAGNQVIRDQAVSDDGDDSDYGWAMFLAFICAVMSITFTVCVLTMVKTWWMLGVTMTVHVGITAVMMRVVLGAFRSSAYHHERSAEPAPRLTVAHG